MKSRRSRIGNILIISIILCATAIQTPEALSATENEIMVTTSADGGVGSLREAINQANNNLVPDVIHFASSLKGAIISLTTSLPAIQGEGTVVDASALWVGTWPEGKPGITLNGSGAIDPSGFIVLGTKDVTIKGFEIDHFNKGIWIINSNNTTIGWGDSGGGGGRMLIHNCTGPGIYIDGGEDNKVFDTYLGTSEDGSQPAPNLGDGITIINSHGNAIGGLGGSEFNIIGANNYGITIGGSKSSWNIIVANWIGISSTNHPIYDGVYIGLDATYNTVGGWLYAPPNEEPFYVCPDFGNDIRYSGRNGVTISGAGNLYNAALGNWMLDNQGNGIEVSNTAKNSMLACNVIGGNLESGIFVHQAGTSGHIIDRNAIGINNWYIPAYSYPNGKHGIGLYDGTSDNFLIGNYIGGNGWSGVALIGADTQYNRLTLNHIGIGPGGEHLGNAFYGVDIVYSHDNDLTQNVIAYNGSFGSYPGVHIGEDTATGNGLFRNSIYENAGVGIELTGRAQNEIGAPVINKVDCPAVSGMGGPIGARVEIFSDYGDEGRYYEGSTTVNSNYEWSYVGNFRGPLLTATVIDSLTHDTSKFSAPFPASGKCNITFLPVTLKYK